MSVQQPRNTLPYPLPPRLPQQPVGGSIIDAQGREIPITEDMIQRACRELENACVQRPR